MSVFISYSREDQARAQVLASRLTNAGFKVWWDIEIPAGAEFAEVIEDRLKRALCVIVIWSAHSVHSRWVREEAEYGKSRGILIPIIVDSVEIPVGFRTLHTEDMRTWAGNEEFGPWRKVVDRVGELCGPPIAGVHVSVPVQSNRTRDMTKLIGLFVGLVAVGLAIFLSLRFLISALAG